MLKKRLIATILIRDDLVVQSIGFSKYLPVGKIDIVIEFLQYWDVDEIVIIDIGATQNKKTIDYEGIKRASRKCFLPISAGGGINKIQDFRNILASGADKVILSSVIFRKKEFISRCAERFGEQSIVACLDVKKIDNGEYRCFIESGTINTSISPTEFIEKNNTSGIGEIIINSIDRDGTKDGYDIELIRSIQNVSSVPIIALGGAGNFDHMSSVLNQTNISAVAAGNIFHFTEHSTAVAKAYLEKSNIAIRQSYLLNYSSHIFDESNRVIPKKFEESI